VGYTTRTVLGAGSLLPLGRAGWLGLHGKPPRLGPLRTGDPHFPFGPIPSPSGYLERPGRPQALSARARGLGRSQAGSVKEEVNIVWWADLLWGFWNGLTAWIVLVVHIFGGWEQFPFYNEARSGNWYDFGFLLGAGSPLLGAVGGRSRRG
jgi:hypothetical protein